MNKQSKHIVLDIELLPEGYYLATSNDVPGLVVEAKTMKEVQDIVEDTAPYLLGKLKKRQEKYGESKKVLGRMFYPMTVMA